MGCRVSAQVALISFLWSALLREENRCVLRVEIWIIAQLKTLGDVLRVSNLSWFRHSFCQCAMFVHVILFWSVNSGLYHLVPYSLIEIIALILPFSPSSINTNSHACLLCLLSERRKTLIGGWNIDLRLKHWLEAEEVENIDWKGSVAGAIWCTQNC